jgi:hypothetical protein
MDLIVRPITDDAVAYVLTHLCEADRIELAEAGAAVDWLPIFQDAAQNAEVSGAVYLNGTPVAVYGCNPLGGSVGIPWMVCTDFAPLSGVAGARLSRRVLAQMLNKYKALTNLVHARHARAIRWLSWLGFAIMNEPAGPNGKFREFWIKEQRYV